MIPRAPLGGAATLLVLLVLGGAASVALEHDTLDWREVQAHYEAGHPGFQRALLATPSATGGPPELCVTCHLASAGFEAEPASPLFAAHPDVHHEPAELGCTLCHAGDAQGVHDHQTVRYGVGRPLPGAQAWASCLRCHSPLSEPVTFGRYRAAGRAQQHVEAAIQRNGCLGCHRLVERGGSQGAALPGIGERRVGDPLAPFGSTHAAVVGRLRALEGVVPGSTMPQPELSAAERDMLAAWLVLNTPLPARAEGRWLPARRLSQGDALRPWGAFCAGCHGLRGEGSERGRQPAAVPTLGSSLFAAFADRGLLGATIDGGRPGTLMEGFGPRRAGGAAGGSQRRPDPAVLTPEARRALVELLASDGLAPPDTARRRRAVEAMAASCSQCHLRRTELYDSLTPEQRAALFEVHPLTFEADTLARVEDPALHAGAAPPGRGEELFQTVCLHCHADPGPRPAGAGEPSGPLLLEAIATPGFSAGFFLANLVAGRGDAAPTRWRHEGLRSQELGVAELLAVLEHLRTRRSGAGSPGGTAPPRPAPMPAPGTIP